MNIPFECCSAENAEFSSAYNDLNDELEKHKTDYGSVLTSNRDLATRIGASSLSRAIIIHHLQNH